MLSIDVLEPRVVLPQVVHPVVVPVRGPHHGVDVLPDRLDAVERDAGLVVELDEDHRAVDAVVEDVLLTDSTHPQEMRVVEMLPDGFQPELGVAFPQLAGREGGQPQELLALARGEAGRPNTLMK